MSFFNNLKQQFREVTQSLTNEVKKYRSKDLLHAISAGCAMVAYADGEVTAAEKQKLMGYVKNSEQLSVFDADAVIESFNKTANRFEFDSMIAVGEALSKISIFKGKPEAHIIVRVCLSIAYADGDFQDAEKRAVGQICHALGLDIKDFI